MGIKKVVLLVGISDDDFTHELSESSPFWYVTQKGWKASFAASQPDLVVSSSSRPSEFAETPYLRLNPIFHRQLLAGAESRLGVALMRDCLDDSVRRRLGDLGPRRGALLDDEPSLALVYRSILEIFNFETTVDFVRSETSAALSGEAPDLMLLDAQMPGLGYLEFARRAKRASPGTRIFLVTGDRNVEAEHVLDGVIHKPFGVQELVGPIKTVIGQSFQR